MNPYGFAPRHWALCVSIELSEVIGQHVLPQVSREQAAEAGCLADEAWRLVARCELLQGARTIRAVKGLRETVASLATRAGSLGLPEATACFLSRKLDEMTAALDDVAADPASPPTR